MTAPQLRKLGIFGAITAASLAVAFFLSRYPFAQTLEWKIYDLEVRLLRNRPDRVSRDIVLVNVDDFSVQNMEESGLGRFPWPRDTYGVLLDFFARARPKVVTFDLVFLERTMNKLIDDSGVAKVTGEEADQAFVDATRRLGNVVHAIEVSDVAESKPDPALRDAQPVYDPGPDIEAHASVRFPFADLARASRMLGHTFVVFDADGPLRRGVPFIRQDNAYYPSLAIATAMLALGVEPSDVHFESDGLHLGDRVVPLMDLEQEYVDVIHTRHILVPYKASAYADAERKKTSYRSYSFWDLFYSELQMRENQKPRIDPGEFKDKIVFVGTTAAGLHDLFQTPYGDSGKMPGMQVHAAIVDGILNNSFIRPGGRTATVLLPILTVTAIAALGVFTGFWWSLAAAAGIVLVDAGMVGWSFGHGVWLKTVPAAIGLGIAQVSSISYKYFVEDRAKRRIQGLFSRYVAPAVVRELLRDPAAVRLGGHRREMSVLFSDIRGFTTLSEGNQPEAVIAQLNEYFSHMVELLFQHHGMLDKFVGDMIMALFNTPIADPDHADHAVQMGLAMLKELAVLNRKWASEGKPQFDIGIGINTGDMIVGNVGSEKTLSYTVIGDNVNLGSRLESLNKEYNTHIIISEATLKKLKGSYNTRPLGSVKVKGKTREVSIFEVCG
jgi:adenylate cyclase